MALIPFLHLRRMAFAIKVADQKTQPDDPGYA